MRSLLSELSQCPGAAEELLAYLLSQPPDASFMTTAAALIVWMGAPPKSDTKPPDRPASTRH